MHYIPKAILIPLAIALSTLSPASSSFAATYTVNSGDTVISTVGNGPNESFGSTVEVNGTISTTNSPAISLGSGTPGTSTININSGAIVQGHNDTGPGKYGTGANLIEVDSGYSINIAAGAVVKKTGRENNGEAINVHGSGNTITNRGTISAENSAAIWFQDWAGHGNGTKNTVDNYGTITRVGGGNVIGTSGGFGINFINREGARVEGDLVFSGGNDTLTFEPDSIVTGNIDGGGGQNDLFLEGGMGSGGGYLAGAIKNFTTLTKNGTGVWTITGSMEGFRTVDVNAGDLVLTGNNDKFSGKITVHTGASLEGRVQSLPTNNPTTGNRQNIHLDGGQLYINQDDDGTYVGQIYGTGQVFKSGAGEVILAPDAGANLYSGGTTIYQGGLGIYSGTALGTGHLTISNGSLIGLADTNLDNITGGIFIGTSPALNTGTFDIRNNSTLTINQDLEGPASTDTNLIKTGNGILALNGSGKYTGETWIYGGTLRTTSNAADNMTGQVHIASGARLEGTGTLGSLSAPTQNAGIIEPGTPANPFGTLTIRGGYQGESGGQVYINSVLGNDSSVHSTLVIKGDTVGSVPTDVRVYNQNGKGGMALNGIPVIRVEGNSSPNDFRLLYDYKHSDGTTTVIGGTTVYYFDSTVSGGVRTFRLHTLLGPDGKPILNPAIPVYEVYPQILAGFNRLDTLQQRVGNRSWIGFDETDTSRNNTFPRRNIEQAGAWARVVGGTGTYRADRSTTEARYDLDGGKVQVGVDYPIHRGDGGSLLVGGINGYYGKADAKVRSRHGDGKIDTDAFGFGGTLTWYHQSGFYVDAQAQASWFDSDLSSDEIVSSDKLKRGNKGFGYAFSLESGLDIILDQHWTVTPQAQLTYSEVDFDSFTDDHNVRVALQKGESLIGRAGVAANYENSYVSDSGDKRRVKAYVLPNVYNEFMQGTEVSVASTSFYNRPARLWGGLSLGGSFDWGDDKYSLYGEVGRRASLKDFDKSRDMYGEIGFRIAF